MQPNDPALIAIALASVACLVLLVVRWQVHGFISLLLASLALGCAAVVFDLAPRGGTTPLTMLAVIDAFTAGLGRSLGGVAALIALGMMIGRLLADSGGAEVLARRFAGWFGPERAVWCVMALGLAVGLTTWFAVGLVLLTPILLTLAREARRPMLALAIPLLSILSVMHGVFPPHPGPVAALAAFRDQQPNVGLVLFWGTVIGLPTAFVAGPLFARRAVRVVGAVALDELPAAAAAATGASTPPTFGVTFLAVLLPVVLMLLDTVARLALAPGTALFQIMVVIGHPTVALLAGVIYAMWALGARCGRSKRQVLGSTEAAIAMAGTVLLVVGGGGGFSAVLQSAGVADAVARLASLAGLPVLVYGWMVAAFIRVATGSATVSIVTAAGLVAPLLATHPEVNVELVIVALGCGSLFLSLPNDAGFWVVKENLGLTVSQTLRTWTVTETLVGVAGLLITWLVDAIRLAIMS